MADIFISYAKADQEQVRLLAAFLEAQGYSVWWDSSLLGGENFRQVIITELAHARLALVLWTETSIQSDWVQSEAGRAHADRKLIPLKTRGLEYRQIPPPFDVLHTENVDAHDNILAAVVGALAKPQAQAPALRLFSKRIRYETLAWVGAIGTALTLINSIGPIMTLADWARYLVDNWGRLLVGAWSTLFAFLPFKIDKVWASVLTANICVLAIALACRRGPPGATDTAARKGSFLTQAPLIVLLSVILIVASGPTPGVPMREQLGQLVVYLLMISSFLLILLAAGGWLVRRGGVGRTLGGVSIMLAASPVAAIVSFASIAALAYFVNPAVLEQVGTIDLNEWPGLVIAAAIVGLLFAVIFSAPLVAVMLADRARLYVRIFRSFAIVALLVLLNLLSLYGPALREMFRPA
jgi:TIR domain-containing protein